MIDASKYTIQIQKVEFEEESYFQAKVKEFPHLDEFADNHQDAYNLAIEAIEASIEALLEKGISVPKPETSKSLDEYSGRVTLRIPRSLHASLAKQAEAEEVSLNHLLVSALSDFNGFEKGYRSGLETTRRVEQTRSYHHGLVSKMKDIAALCQGSSWSQPSALEA